MTKRNIFKKRPNTKTKGIYMPYKRKSKEVLPKRKKSIFKNNNYGKRRKNLKNILPIFISIIGISLVIGLIYLSVIYITKLRNNSDEEYIETYVVGLKDIPAYPNSEFIFEKNISDISISNFLSQENSAYRLPEHSDIEDVFEFYNQKLPQKGWTHILSVPIKADDKEYGEYWLKEEKGLRIYSKFNDIWYETISKEDAETGLASRIKSEIERDMMLASSDTQEFLPDYPWLLNIPKEYIISYSSSDMGSLRKLMIKKVDGSEEISITPIGYTGAKELDYFLDDYIKLFKDEKAGINNTIVINKPGIRGTIFVDNNIHLIAVLPNSYNNVVYVIDSDKGESPFFEYVLENIIPQSSLKY